tara:strand:+ start:10720 stop:12345 length:1626 start_codon:yes stop_codon:yes gene_type:complete
MANRKLSALTALTAPASDDVFLVLDSSVSDDSAKNKKIEFGTLFTELPVGAVDAPSFGFTGDSDATGFFRSAADEIAISTNDALNSKFTTTGFQIGSGTAGAQFHTFKTTTGDDVIIENSEAGSGEGPNFVLYRNSASPAADDVLGTLEFRGKDSANGTASYAEITAGIVDTTDASEDGRIDFNTTVSGSSFTTLRLQGKKVGINEAAPETPIHVTNADNEIELLRLECTNTDAASGADITLYRHRNGGVGLDDDVLSTVFFKGNNDDATEADRQLSYAAIQSEIADASVDEEDGILRFQVQAAGTLTTQLEIESDKVEFFQDVDLASGKEFKINGASILNATTLGSSVVSSSLTSVGTIGTGTWNGTAVGVTYGGTGLTATPADNQILLGNGTGFDLKTLTAGSNVTFAEDGSSITINATSSQGDTNTAGNGIDITGSEISVDLKANGGLVIESTELALDLAATSITGTLPVTKLSSLTSTVTELNILDGDTSATSTTLAATDRMVINDDGTMVQVALSDLVTFLENETVSNLDIDGGTY